MDENIKKHKEYLNNNDIIDRYFAELNEKEIAALNVAFKYLGSSFSILKSSGYRKWVAKQNEIS
tara:strand:+ start:2257 stop:2448 length:192 start_codon:yes stop_codon:yes gene_type:complete